MREGLLALSLALTLGATSSAASEETFVQAGPNGVLKGTMLSPQARSAPVALIIPGSGPTDRDGNNPLGVKAATYRLLSEALAVRGVASVRIDKRGMFASAGAQANPNDVTIDDYAADIHAWIDALKHQTGARCVWLIGHSEGGLVALAASRKPEGVCGLVLVSTAGRPMGEVLRDQLKANPANAELLTPAMTAIDNLEAGRTVDVANYPAALQGLFNPAVQKFLIDMFSFDPEGLVRGFPGPVLVVQGATDLQVAVTDAERLAKARPGVELALIEGANHVLKTAPLDRGPNLATYADPSLPLADGVAEAISAFILKGNGGSPG